MKHTLTASIMAPAQQPPLPRGVYNYSRHWLGIITVITLVLPLLALTQTGCHLVQRDPDGAVWWWVIWVESQELLAQQTQTLRLPARLFLRVVLFFCSFKLETKTHELLLQ